MMNSQPTETGSTIVTATIDVAVAVLTEKVNQVIGDHERRISALELINSNRPTKGATLISPFIAGGALVLLVADKINWS